MRIQAYRAITAAVVLATALGTASQPMAGGSPAVERIVFSSRIPEGGSMVSTAAPDGSDRLDLSIAAELEDFTRSVWSHDGTRLLYSNVVVPLGPEGEDVAFRPATSAPDGSDFHLLALPDRPSDMYCSAWSTDDSRMLCSDDTGGIISIRADDGSGAFRLTSNPYGAQDLPVGYSPDGTRLAFLRYKPGPNDHENPGQFRPERVALMVADEDGANPARITEWGQLEPHELAGANWSPDGRSLITASPRGTLLVVAADGSRVTPLHLDLGTGNYFAVTPDYSPDGTHIVFALFLTGTAPDLYVSKSDGSDAHPITTTPETSERFPDWAAIT